MRADLGVITMIDPQNFWDLNYYDHPPLTDEMVRIAEAQLSVTLPASYIDLLRIQNGGYTHRFAYPIQERTTWPFDHISLDSSIEKENYCYL